MAAEVVRGISSVVGLHCWHSDDLLFADTGFLVPTGWQGNTPLEEAASQPYFKA
jgi:hypothetical protein